MRKFSFIIPLLAVGNLCAQMVDFPNQVKRKAYVDVRQFGVKGNGVTDDTVAFQAAITAAGRGGTVYVPNFQNDVVVNGATLTLTQEGTRIECASMDQFIRRTAAGAIFTVSAGSNEITNCGLKGNRTLGSIGISTGGSRGRFHQLRCDTLAACILNTGGFHNTYSHVWARNIRSYVAKITNGVSPFFDHITHDTDAGNDITDEGGIIVQTEGVYINDCDLLGARHGVLIQPVNRDITWTFLSHVRLDQSFNVGVFINNTTAYTVRGVFMNDVWAASTGMGPYTYAGLASTDGVGMMFNNNGAGVVDWITCIDCKILNQRKENVKVLGTVTNVSFTDVQASGANQAAAANIDSFYVEATGPVSFTGGRIVASPAPNTHRAGITAGPTSGRVNIDSVQFDTSSGTWSAGTPIYNVANTQGNIRNFGYSPGLDDVMVTIASAGTVSIPVQSTINFSGTTAINTINSAWVGRKLNITKTDAGSITFGTAGNIAVGFTLAQNENAICEYPATKWICRK